MNEDELFSYTLTDDETPSEGVIKTVASLEGSNPMALDTPLYTVVDPDALDQLFTTKREGENPVSVTFAYDDYEVTVQNSGTILVRPSMVSVPDESS